MSRTRTALVAAALVAALAGAPGARGAEPIFSGDGTRLAPPQLAAAGGIAVAAWSEAQPGEVRAAIRRGGHWGTPTVLPLARPAIVADVAVDARGTALVAVVEPLPLGERSRLRVLAARTDGGWTASRQLAPAGARFLRGVTLAAGPDGTVLVAFERYDPPRGRSTVMAAARPAGGAWTAARAVSRPVAAYEYGLDPDVAAGPGGRAIVAWSDRGGRLLAAGRGAGGRWAPPVRLSPSGFGAQVAFAPDGRALAVWGVTDRDGAGQLVRARERSPAGRWGAPRTLYAPPGNGGLGPRLAMGPAGDAAIAVLPTDGSMLTVHAATRLARGAFTPFRRLSRPMRIPPLIVPAVAVDETGTAGLAWSSGGRVRLATRRPGAGWTTRTAGAAHRPPSLAAAGGRMLVGWIRRDDEIVVADMPA